jgi:hypothetical protein
VLDDAATHKHPKVQAWLNLAEVCFAIIERQALRRGDLGNNP